MDEIIKKVEGSIIGFPSQIYRFNRAIESVESARDFLLRLKDRYSFIPTSALIRKELRSRIRYKWKNNKNLRHFFMGKLGRFSAIHIYWNGRNWEFRIWGWIPKDMQSRIKQKNNNISRNNIINFLKELFNSQDFWKEIFDVDCIEKPDEENYIFRISR